MAEAIQVFEYDENLAIRTVEIDGQRWAVAADICAALEIKDPPASLRRIDAADKMVISRSDTRASNQGIWRKFAAQVQSVGLISEDGATDLVLDSRKPEARRFRRWLTHTVWPSIRETGSYSIDQQPRLVAGAMSDDDILSRAVLIANTRITKLSAENETLRDGQRELTAAIERDAPKVEAYERFMSSDGMYSIGVVAKMIGWGPNRLFSELRRRGVLISRGDKYNCPYQRYMKHFDIKTRDFERDDGTSGRSYTPVVRPSGIQFIAKMVNRPLLEIVEDDGPH